MVASAGASIPAPLAIPVKVVPRISFEEILGFVSVVIIARALESRESTDSDKQILWMPANILCIGKSSPIKPVEQTATSDEDIPKALATVSAVK
ncbi:unannotated protein [freshwater metagenome]|uniref:Unannotated protein n=1 Tax=freshwater metagenome TaxID=449393 RepID=A0A6J7MAX5_9ZZZZ